MVYPLLLFFQAVPGIYWSGRVGHSGGWQGAVPLGAGRQLLFRVTGI